MNNTYKTGKDRQQTLLFPPSLDELISKDNPVQGIDSYVDILDVLDLGFNNKNSTAADAPSLSSSLIVKNIH